MESGYFGLPWALSYNTSQNGGIKNDMDDEEICVDTFPGAGIQGSFIFYAGGYYERHYVPRVDIDITSMCI